MRYLLCFLLAVSCTSAAWANSLSPPLLRAIEHKNWADAHSESRRDKALASYVQWRFLLDDDAPLDFAALASFIDHHADWPRLNVLRNKAEKALFQSGNQGHKAERWLNRYPPLSGYGMLALSRFDNNSKRIRAGWIQGDFERHDEKIIRAEFGKWLDTATHEQRAERLLFEGKASASERLLGDVRRSYAKLMKARIGLQRKAKNIDGLVGSVPSSHSKDDGLLADRAIWRHKKGLASGARALLVAMHPNSAYAKKLWRIRASYARDAIEAGQYKAAKKLLGSAGNKLNTANKADALWLKGWLELSFLKRPRDAYESFNQLFHSVSYPVSKARGAYWAARAAERNGNQDIANGWYERAAAHPTAFYGQLALAHLHPKKPLSLPASPKANRAAKSRYRSHKLWQIATQLHSAGAHDLAVPLIYHLASGAENAGEFAALAELAGDAKMLHAKVIITKLAMRKHIILAQGWPIVQPPKDAPLPPELALAISRQESEFNPQAVSRANARGLMQLLPSTARKTAQKIGHDYSLRKLFDPVYNMRLGSQYLGDLISGFDGNYILAIAGYNAGPGRSRQWVERFGWPGKDLDSTLTFLELIPFSETRNYVQRVLENAQVYRARMNPKAPLMIEQDLLR